MRTSTIVMIAFAVVFGLLASLIGDVLLMLPQDLFVAGLIAFLVAHIAYLVAFTDGVRFAARPATLALFLVVAGAILWLLWPGLPTALRVPVGATLVRHSTPAGEVAETHTTAAGLLSALGAVPSQPPAVRGSAQSPEVQRLLAARNDELARFWLDSRAPGALTVPSLSGRHAVIVDAEDTFTVSVTS